MLKGLTALKIFDFSMFQLGKSNTKKQTLAAAAHLADALLYSPELQGKSVDIVGVDFGTRIVLQALKIIS